jgi:hypothetical protein
MSRLEKLKAMLAARLDQDGRARDGYAQNVADIRKEIARLSGN